MEALKAHRKRQPEQHLEAGLLFQDRSLVFSTENGEPPELSDVDRRSFKPLLEKVGLPNIRFHDLRHTCATLPLTAGLHPKIVQKLLGHSTIAISLGT